jgi:hypothetical protein
MHVLACAPRLLKTASRSSQLSSLRCLGAARPAAVGGSSAAAAAASMATDARATIRGVVFDMVRCARRLLICFFCVLCATVLMHSSVPPTHTTA